MNILDKILEYKRQEVAELCKKTPVGSLPERDTDIRDFSGALQSDGISIIAEIKRKSPSEGNLFLDLDPVDVARSYQESGANALSVLTDHQFFGGDLDFLRQIREKVDLPVLRKDFIISEYQVMESYAAGADAILLILEAMEFAELQRLYNQAQDLGLHVLVESYTIDSLTALKKMRPHIAGINSRDLSTMKVDFDAMLAKKAKIQEECITVAESGIVEPVQLLEAFDAGFDAALIGTAFMRNGSPGETLKNFVLVATDMDDTDVPG